MVNGSHFDISDGTVENLHFSQLKLLTDLVTQVPDAQFLIISDRVWPQCRIESIYKAAIQV